MTPAQAIKQATQKFAAEGITPYQINDGYCEDWADNVFALLKRPNKVEYWQTPFCFANTSHSFLRINGLFYDAARPQGTKDHMDLPIFAKLFAIEKRRQPVWLIDHNMGWTFKGENKRDMTDAMVAEYNEMFDPLALENDTTL